jgi:hypothetical protein
VTLQEVLPPSPDKLQAGRDLIPLERALMISQDALRFAEVIASTQFVPAGLRGKPDAILAAIMYGSELGLGPMQALSEIAVIDGRPSLSASAQRGLIRAAGHRIWTVELTNTRCILAGQRIGEDRSEEVTWTMDDAKRAGLSGKSNWRSYPRQMLFARATADLARMLFSDVLGGFPATEEEIESAETPPVGSKDGETHSSPPTRRRRRAQSPEAAPGDAPEPEAAVEPSPTPEEPTKAEPTTEPPGGGEPLPGQTDLEEEVAAEELLAAQAAAEETAAEEKLTGDLEASAAAAATEPELITSDQRKKMQALFRERDVTDREARLAYVSHVARRKIASSNDLTIAEAGRVIDALEQWNPNDPESKPFPEYDPATEPFPEGY